MVKIDAMGQVCPLPVINTKKALKLMKGNDVAVISVDNKIATENLQKMCVELNFQCSVQKISDEHFEVTIIKGVGGTAKYSRTKTVIAITSGTMGTGNDELGSALMKSFIFSLTESETLPDKIIFYNRGVTLPVEGGNSLDDIKKLEEMGVEILACGACLNYYGLTEKLAVGSVTNMYSILEALMNAEKVIKP